ncbi:unnamed protein product [Eruca vesicaria subsp. sativa]|uniref:Uncharacterized protein n=1 Tax=Eruca vesicaria subsp. sativa TaxID=29727 RepID=A0ABC8JP99_ERUVS|nr:unnamed protein product [Eruca vesicaria subsp. sativa]
MNVVSERCNYIQSPSHSLATSSSTSQSLSLHIPDSRFRFLILFPFVHPLNLSGDGTAAPLHIPPIDNWWWLSHKGTTTSFLCISLFALLIRSIGTETALTISLTGDSITLL